MGVGLLDGILILRINGVRGAFFYTILMRLVLVLVLASGYYYTLICTVLYIH